MLRDCLEIFSQELESTKDLTGDADRLILDEYIPADGDYLIVGKDGTIEGCSLKLDKKTRTIEQYPVDTELYEKICFYDYHSKLVSMDKPQDPKKVIHSNNYMSFWVKWDSLDNGKLDSEAIDRYFNVLKEPEKKYTSPKDRSLYEYIKEQIGEINQEKLEENRKWIKDNVFTLDNLGLDLKKKNYLKIYFENERDVYVNEEKRYLTVKIFNSNDYNLEISGQILGLPNDNMGLNSKKPFLRNKTRKNEVPYLITPEEAMLQKKFFDYLMNKANAGKTDIYFDHNKRSINALGRGEMPDRDFSGFFLSIQKGKELEIHHQDTIVDYKYFLQKPFTYKNVLGVRDERDLYRKYKDKKELQGLINDILFNKWLAGNYFSLEENISADSVTKRNILWSRGAIFAWLYKGNEVGIESVLKTVSFNMINNSILNGWLTKAKDQVNLMCSLDDYFRGDNMTDKYSVIRTKLREKINCNEDCVIESNEEYFYAVGQLVNYFISLSKTKEKTHSLANPFFHAIDNKVIKMKLGQFFMKYNYQIGTNRTRFNRMYAMVLAYEAQDKINREDIMVGYLSDSLIYEKKSEEEL